MGLIHRKRLYNKIYRGGMMEENKIHKEINVENQKKIHDLLEDMESSLEFIKIMNSMREYSRMI